MYIAYVLCDSSDNQNLYWFDKVCLENGGPYFYFIDIYFDKTYGELI